MDESIHRLQEVMRRLRDPQHGCSWDKAQTLESLAPYVLEEAHEVVAAIDSGDRVNLCEELGDLLLQVVFQAQIASEQGWFSFEDVAAAIVAKLERRHPHVFGDTTDLTPAEVEQRWELIKAEEKRAKGEVSEGLLDGVAAGMPAWVRARKLQKKAAEVGFDWPSTQQVMDKLHEEVEELAIVLGKDADAEEDELGDVMFVLANLARHRHLDPETALRRSNDKFVRRFRYIEDSRRQQHVPWEALTLEQMEAWWQQAKVLEKVEPR